MLTSRQREVAARKLCELRGIDPEQSVAHGADPSPDGYTPAVLLYSPAWLRALREIEAQDILMDALRQGFLDGR